MVRGGNRPLIFLNKKNLEQNKKNKRQELSRHGKAVFLSWCKAKGHAKPK